MNEAALAISIIAVIFAALAVRYTRRQALSAGVVARNDTERLRRDVAPRFEAEVEDMRSWFRLWLRLVEHGPLARMTVEILEPRGARFHHGQDGVDPSLPSERRTALLDPVDLGERTSRRIEWDDERPDVIRLRITAYAVQDPKGWATTMSVPIPQDRAVKITKAVLHR